MRLKASESNRIRGGFVSLYNISTIQMFMFINMFGAVYSCCQPNFLCGEIKTLELSCRVSTLLILCARVSHFPQAPKAASVETKQGKNALKQLLYIGAS